MSPVASFAIRLVVVAVACIASAVASTGACAATEWRSLAKGLELAQFDPPGATAAREDAPDAPDARIVVLRIDPAFWQLEYAAADEPPGHTAREWSRRRGYVAAINAGMYAADFRTHIGYVRHDGRDVVARANRYQSVAAFAPLPGRAVPPFRLVDLDEPARDIAALTADYGSLVQNLRLIDRQRTNRWRDRGQRWSEVALGEDASGRILFLFTRQPVSMPAFNAALLALPIDLVAAQHLEGGREAQLFVSVGDESHEFIGVRLLPFSAIDEPAQAWPVPNILGVRAKVEGQDTASADAVPP